MKKKVFYTEVSYALAMVLMAFAAASTAKSGFGVSMVVAPAYILHLKISEFLPWFSFGVSEYLFQGLLVVLTVLAMRKFKKGYLFSFVTAVLYGTLLDGAIALIAPLPADAFWMRAGWILLGTTLCSFSVSLFFHTYISPEAYELIVKELAEKFPLDIHKIKRIYDISSLILAVVLSFCFFGFGVFRGVGWGTAFCALVNSLLIGRWSKLLEKHFEFRDRFPFARFFK